MDLKPGLIITLPVFLGSAEVWLLDEYRPGIWQVKSMETGTEFLISTHVMKGEE